MIIKNEKELSILRECGRKLAMILGVVEKAVKPGVTTKELDDLSEKLIRDSGGEPVFKGYRTLRGEPPFPCSLCTSVNDEVVHGIPSGSRVLKEGDIVGLDIGMRWPAKDGFITDMAVTVGVGKISQKAERLIAVTKDSFEKGIAVLAPGIRLGDLGAVIQNQLEKNGYGVIRDLAGHGVGRKLHEEPFVPNYGKRGAGPVVLEGTVLAIEPMATEGDWHVVLDKDGWTFKTRDGKLAAHFEHTVVVTKDGAKVLTTI
ncbi:MAG: type I methionyl aminopeptidase [bacterium]|nr:type I methionyl aminopeptidase [bacterium]